MTTSARPTLDAIRGALLGTAVGDTIGLPYEGLSARRVARWAPARLTHRFVLGRGMVSDDTEHTVLVGHALASTRSVEGYEAALAAGLRRWLRTCPGGVGGATQRALVRLNLGLGPRRSGVCSAGNGPAMRAALVGLCVPPDALDEYIAATTVLTHTDPRAQSGAKAVALATRLASEGASGAALLSRVAAGLAEPELKAARLPPTGSCPLCCATSWSSCRWSCCTASGGWRPLIEVSVPADVRRQSPWTDEPACAK